MKTMLDYFKEKLFPGMTIKSVSETKHRYKIIVEYSTGEAKVLLPKTCEPGCHYNMCVEAITGAILEIYFGGAERKAAKLYQELCELYHFPDVKNILHTALREGDIDYVCEYCPKQYCDVCILNVWKAEYEDEQDEKADTANH